MASQLSSVPPRGYQWRDASHLVLIMSVEDEPDGNNEQSVRKAMHKLARVARRQNCAVLVQRHLNKSSGKIAIYRGGGSIGIAAHSWSALLVEEAKAYRYPS